ncbi:hypothetical protein O181_123037 [Austropuccinia psidii MF-1]|uniref:Reverse transcriptase Ty1/copia-type domain-containing protein n=1 Tax=Austropuccinia psidii MF-1 TaxID=1389203 RepID=A0A9Q3KPA5_9BASI|nr:hypothetical protein [Austropuccinia psidii MF-1]
MSLIQDKYIHQILIKFNTDQVRPSLEPLPFHYKESKNLGGNITDPPPFSYERSVGLIQYIIQCTRPDLTFAISVSSQFLEDPKDFHYRGVIHTLKYLSGTQNFTLNLGKNLLKHFNTQIIGFPNSEWGWGTEKKLFSGLLIYFHGLLGWNAHKKIVSLSSAEAQYNSLNKSAQALLWLQQLISDATNTQPKCLLHPKNKSAIAITSNPVYHHGKRNINF